MKVGRPQGYDPLTYVLPLPRAHTLTALRSANIGFDVLNSPAYFPYIAAGWLCDLLDAAQLRLPAFEPQHISTSLWALAKMGFHPGEHLGTLQGRVGGVPAQDTG